MKDIGYDLRLMPDFKDEEDETEDEKKKRIGYPTDNIEDILKELGCEKSVEKIKEHMIKDQQFWDLTEDELKDLLDI
jgi:chemotaxis regulatin CheY-phosphate phosphatase CheZ